jgi:hypothetical protein
MTDAPFGIVAGGPGIERQPLKGWQRGKDAFASGSQGMSLEYGLGFEDGDKGCQVTPTIQRFS